MKGFIGALVTGVVLIGALLCCLFCLERIPAGYVGVVYQMDGGVQDEILQQGFHLISPTQSVKEFTVGKAKLIAAQAEADANKVLAASITQELIEMKEAEAHMEHGFVTVQGANTVVTPAA